MIIPAFPNHLDDQELAVLASELNCDADDLNVVDLRPTEIDKVFKSPTISFLRQLLKFEDVDEVTGLRMKFAVHLWDEIISRKLVTISTFAELYALTAECSRSSPIRAKILLVGLQLCRNVTDVYNLQRGLRISRHSGHLFPEWVLTVRKAAWIHRMEKANVPNCNGCERILDPRFDDDHTDSVSVSYICSSPGRSDAFRDTPEFESAHRSLFKEGEL